MMGTNASGSTPGAEKTDTFMPRRRPPADADLGLGGHSVETTATVGVVSPRRDGGVRKMLGRKRLVLVLDLDHTLLHSIYVRALSPQELYLLREPQRKWSPLLCDTRSTLGFLTKLRPFVHTFLREASTMYDFYICTNAARAYAGEMARMLDPNGVYFSSDNVISRMDFTVRGKKGLDVVRRGDERTIVVLDDTVDVWKKRHRDNIVQISPYHYFSCSRKTLGDSWRPPSELRSDETSGVLATKLDLLRQVHHRFFYGSSEGDLSGRDVRSILQELTQKKQDNKGYDDDDDLLQNDHLSPQQRKDQQLNAWISTHVQITALDLFLPAVCVLETGPNKRFPRTLTLRLAWPLC